MRNAFEVDLSRIGLVDRIRGWLRRRRRARVSARPLAGDPGQVVVELEFPREGIRHHETIPLASYRMTLDAFVRIAAAGRHIDRIEVLDEVDLGHPPPAEARPPADSARGPIEIPPAAPRLP